MYKIIISFLCVGLFCGIATADLQERGRRHMQHRQTMENRRTERPESRRQVMKNRTERPEFRRQVMKNRTERPESRRQVMKNRTERPESRRQMMEKRTERPECHRSVRSQHGSIILEHRMIHRHGRCIKFRQPRIMVYRQKSCSHYRGHRGHRGHERMVPSRVHRP